MNADHIDLLFIVSSRFGASHICRHSLFLIQARDTFGKVTDDLISFLPIYLNINRGRILLHYDNIPNISAILVDDFETHFDIP